MSDATKDGTRAPRGERVQDAFAEAVAMPTLARLAFLARLRGEDETLADEVESLLAYHARPGAIESPTLSLPGSLVGETIGGCRLDALIGYGGMSAVYAATQFFPPRRVAVKLVRPERLGDSARRRLRVEAEALARLEHPNIARVYAAGVERIGGKAREGADDTPESPYIVMEIIEGAVSVTKWADGQRLDARARIELVARIADAIAHAHGAGVIHRDLKPGNVVVGRDGVPKVIDFGIAAVADSMVTAVTEGPMGTLAYMSPEQARGVSVDARSDIWGLGALLYDLLAGEPPFDARDRSLAAHVERLLHDAPEPIAARAAGHRGMAFTEAIPQPTDAVLHKALATDPERRYRSAAEFADELRRLVRGEALIARPDSEWEGVLRLCRRHRASLAAATGIFAATVAALVVSLSLLDRERAAHARAEWAAYVAAISAASVLLDQGDASAAAAMLETAPRTHRGWEWRALERRTSQVAWSIDFERGNQVYGVEFTRDGKSILASASDSFGMIDVATRSLRWRTRHQVEGPAWRLKELADGHFVGIVLFGPTLRFDPTGAIVQSRTISDMLDIALTADGKRLFGSFVGGAIEIDPITLDVMRTVRVDPPLTEFPRAIAAAPDGAFLVTGDVGGEVVAFDAATGAVRWRWRPESNIREIRSVSVSADGSLVAASGGGHLAVFDARSGEVRWSVSETGRGYRSPTFTPDGRELVVANYGETVDRHDLATGARIGELVGSNGQVWCCAVAPDGSTIAAGGFTARVDVFGARDASIPSEHALDGSPVIDLAVGLRVHAVTERGGLFAISPGGDPRRIATTARARSVCELPDGSLAVGLDTGVAWLDAEGRPLRTVATSSPALQVGVVDAGRTTLAVLEEKRQLAIDSASTETLWAFDNCVPGARPACETGVPEKLFVCRGNGPDARVLDRTTMQDVGATLELEYSLGAALSPDRRVIAVGNVRKSGEVLLLDSRIFATIAALPNHRAGVRTVAWSPDGSRLASVGTDDSVRIWHVGRATEVLTAWRKAAFDAAYDADGTLWLACGDGKVRAISAP
jgi:serine/threonine protein kinase/WD40 repeat protein